ncbi:MAG: agmatine deiminase [Treponema sp.]|nr:agmatine deiminase [Treponema sp.]
MKLLNTTPRKDGFRMPGEFEPHEGCWILWPERPDNWRLGAKPAQTAFVKVAEAILQFEPVTVGVSARQYDNAVASLPAGVRVVEISNDDSWVRDCGPTFVKNDAGVIRGVDWEFNAWGGLVDGLYFPWNQDDLVAHKICEIERKDSYRTDGFVLEGGSIHTDGEGTLFTTEECLLSEGRNPHMNKEEIEETLKEYLGVQKIIWLKRGIYNDETNGHVDNILCVVKPGTIMLAWTDDKNDPQYEISAENLKLLEDATDANGRKLEIIKMPLPRPVLITKEESGGVDAIEGTLPRMEGDRLAASYVNFYIANGGIVFPLLDDATDKQAEELLKKAFPGRKTVGVSAREILLGGGNIHCITQQQPK